MAIRDEVYVDIIAQTKKSISDVAKLGAAIGVAIVTVKKVGDAMKAAFEAVQYANQLNQIKRAFSSMADKAGVDSDAIVDALREMSGATISELDLIRSASKASLLGLPLDDLEELMAIARSAATATGQDVKQMFDDIVTGVGRASPLILDNLGIVVKVGEANDKYAETLGKTAEELSASERKQAMLNATLEAGRKIMVDVGAVGQEITDAEQWQRLTSAMDDLKGSMGAMLSEAFNPAVASAATFVRHLADSVKESNRLKDIWKEAEGNAREQLKHLKEQQELTSQFVGSWLQLTKLGVELNENQQESLDALRMEWYLRNLQIEALEHEIAIQEVGAKRLAETVKLDEQRAGYAKIILAYQESMKDPMVKQLEELQSILGVARDLKMTYEEGTDEWRKWENLIKRYLADEKALQELIAETLKSEKDVTDEKQKQKAERKLATEFEKEIKDIAERKREAEEEFREGLEEEIELQEGLKEAEAERLEAYEEGLGRVAEMSGHLIAGMIQGEKAFKEAVKDTMSALLKALAREAIARAAIAFATLNIPMAGALTAAAALAYAGAEVIQSLQKGGITKKDTLAYLHKDEAVIPLDRAPAVLGTTIINHYHIQGSIWSERELKNLAVSAVGEVSRGY